MIDEYLIKVGDNVLVNQGSSTNKYAVCEVLELFERLDDDPYRARVRWYYLYSELSKHHQQQVGMLCYVLIIFVKTNSLYCIMKQFFFFKKLA